MRLGNWVFAWGLVVIAVGLVLSFADVRRLHRSGRSAIGQRRLFSFLRDMLFFTPFLFAG